MKNCPNCGRPTLRTEDWACQWCGYPLLSRSYQKIPKTYREIKEEALSEWGISREERGAEDAAEPDELEREPIAEAAAEPEMAKEAGEEAPEEQIIESETEKEPAPKPTGKRARQSVPKAKPEPEPEPEPVTEGELLVESEKLSGEAPISVEELNSVFTVDKAATNAKFTGRTLQVAGVVDKVFLRGHLDIRYIILAGAGRKGAWRVRCTFDEEQSSALRRLAEGQKVIVQGEYDGCERNILLKNCAIIG